MEPLGKAYTVNPKPFCVVVQACLALALSSNGFQEDMVVVRFIRPGGFVRAEK